MITLLAYWWKYFGPRLRKRAKSVFEKIVGKGRNLFVTYTCSLSCLAVTAGAHVRIWELEQPVTNSPSDGKSVPNFCGFFLTARELSRFAAARGGGLRLSHTLYEKLTSLPLR